MFGLKKSDDYQPVAWMGQYPVYVTTLLVILHVITMIGTSLGIALNHIAFLDQLGFSSDAVLTRGSVWQFITYPFLHQPTIWFAIEMFLLFSFGREVEKYIGRKAFITLYLTLLLLPPSFLTAAGAFVPTAYRGSDALHFAVFVAFAALYPNVEFFGRILVKWIVLALLAIYTLQHLANHHWTPLAVLWASTAAAYLYVAYARGVQGLPVADFFKRLFLKEKPIPLRRQRPSAPAVPHEDVHSIIDPLLEKISRSGLASLTAKERQKLERARATLLKKKEGDL